jgi:mono/diheme cytochrome c family protein
MTIEGTPEQVARGEYLVNVSCANCHGHVGGEGVPDGHPLTGGWDIGADQGFGFIGKFAAENLTPGGKLAEYSDGEIFRAIRQSVNKKSQRLGFMAFLPYNQLSDEDTKAIVAYLRSLPAEQSTRETGNKPNFVGVLLFGSGMMSFSDIVRGEVTAPAQGATPEYGHYVTIYAECRGCHGQDMRGMPASALGPAVINPRPFVATLTLEQFSEMMRSGIRPDGTAFSPAMPWQNASKLTDEDMAALYNYLVEPVE